jgi:hypothetical protein
VTCHSRCEAAPYQTRGDRALRRQHQRMAPGLADAHDGDLARIGLRQRGELVDRSVQILDRLRVGQVVADVAAMKRGLVRVLVEEIGRDADEAVARETRRQIARVLHQAVAFMHEHDGRQWSVRGRHGQESRESAVAGDGLGGDIGQSYSTMLGLRRFWSQSIKLTCLTSMSQRRSPFCATRWPHQPERNRVPSTRNSLIRKFERTMRTVLSAVANTSTFEIIRTVRDFGACDHA